MIKAGVTLNPDKCVFPVDQVTFLGHQVDRNGISPSPKRVTAITKMPKPENVKDIRRFLGMVNQLNKFSPNLAEKSKLIRL